MALTCGDGTALGALALEILGVEFRVGGRQPV
jgi:hypothetical protein